MLGDSIALYAWKYLTIALHGAFESCDVWLEHIASEGPAARFLVRETRLAAEAPQIDRAILIIAQQHLADAHQCSFALSKFAARSIVLTNGAEVDRCRRRDSPTVLHVLCHRAAVPQLEVAD